MKKFLLKISIFIFSILVIFFLKILYMNDWHLIFNKINNTQFKNKLKTFNQSIINKKRINLILGSSLANDAFKTKDWNERNWLKFTNISQNIFESYLFLNHYKEKINIDTILIVIQPFDFRDEINENFNDNSNGSFKIFKQGHNKENYSRSFFTENMQLFINDNFYGMEYLTSSIAEKSKEYLTNNIAEKSNLVRPLDIDYQLLYFMGVKNPPKIDALKEFDLLAKGLDIEVFYIITPKENKYLDSITMDEDNRLAWNYVKSYILESKSNLINLEYTFYNRNEDYFTNETHLNEKGAEAFTKIIKKRLRD